MSLRRPLSHILCAYGGSSPSSLPGALFHSVPGGGLPCTPTPTSPLPSLPGCHKCRDPKFEKYASYVMKKKTNFLSFIDLVENQKLLISLIIKWMTGCRDMDPPVPSPEGDVRLGVAGPAQGCSRSRASHRPVVLSQVECHPDRKPVDGLSSFPPPLL